MSGIQSIYGQLFKCTISLLCAPIYEPQTCNAHLKMKQQHHWQCFMVIVPHFWCSRRLWTPMVSSGFSQASCVTKKLHFRYQQQQLLIWCCLTYERRWDPMWGNAGGQKAFPTAVNKPHNDESRVSSVTHPVPRDSSWSRRHHWAEDNGKWRYR